MKRTLRFISLFLPFLLVLSLAGFIALEKVTQIECVLEATQCPPETLQLLDRLKGQKLFFTDLHVAAATALQSYPEVQVQDLVRVWPTTVKVTLKPSQPVYRVTSGDQHWVATHDGYLIKTQEGTSTVPQIYIADGNLLMNESISPQFHERLTVLLHSLEAEKISYREIEVQSETRVLVLLETKTAVLSLDAPAYDSKRLSLVLKGLEPDKLDTVREIDLRYKFPVLRNESTVPRQKSQ